MLTKNFSIYTAESKVKDFKSVIKAMLSGLLGGRYLAFRLFIKEVKADYSQSVYGVLWDFLEPMVLAAIFILLRRGNVINAGEIHVPYSVFVVYGLLLWQTFSEAITLPLQIMQRSKTLLTQVKIPPESLLLSVFFKVLFNSFFRIVVLLALSFFMNALSWVGFAKFLMLYPSIILVGMAFGVLLAPFNVIYSDVGRVVNIVLRPLLYASPVLYAIPPVKFLVYFNAFNPVGIVLSNLRSLATQNLFQNIQPFMITCTILFILFLLGWFIFHLSIPILSDKL